MRKISTVILNGKGEEQTISVWVDDKTAEILGNTNDEAFVRQYIQDEYRSSLINRKETRRHQSLDASMDGGFDVMDKDADVEYRALKKEEYRKLYAAIRQLEPQQRWLVEQIFFRERKQAEIAAELGVGESAIRSRLKKIFEKMKKFLI